MTDALATVTEHLATVEQLAAEYRQWRSDIILGTRTDDPAHLYGKIDEEVCAIVSAWETIGAPDDLRPRIELLPNYDKWRISSFVDPATDQAFNNIVQADTWAPTPLDAVGTPPPFPVHALPDWTQDHARATATQVQVPVDMTGMLIIGALSAACTGRARVQVSPNWSEPVNLYLVTAMRSGSGKSAAEGLCCQWIRDWQKERMDAVMDDWNIGSRILKVAERKVKEVENGMSKGSQTMDDMKFALRELDEAKDNLPDMPRLLADDATPEAIATLLAAHGERLAILSTEADLFDMLLRGKQGARVNMNVYLKAWSGDSLIRDRKGGSETGPEFTNLEHPLLTVSCTVQPSILARLANDEEMSSRGLSARFMVALPEDLIGRRDQDKRFDGAEIATSSIYAKTATALADDWARHDTPAAINVTDPARNALRSFLAEVEPKLGQGARYEHLAEWTNKLHGSIARYAGLLHLAEGRPTQQHIDVDTMLRAIDLGRYWLAVADIILSMGDETTEQARAIMSWIDRNHLDQFTVRDLQRGVKREALGLVKAVDYLPALDHLIELGWLTPSSPDWADNVGVRNKSGDYFSVWSETTTESACVPQVECRTMGERETFSSPTDTSNTGGPSTFDLRDTPDTTTDPGPVDNPTPDYSHIDF